MNINEKIKKLSKKYDYYKNMNNDIRLAEEKFIDTTTELQEIIDALNIKYTPARVEEEK